MSALGELQAALQEARMEAATLRIENTRLHLAESHAGCDLLACDVKRELTGLAHGVATLKQENTRLSGEVEHWKEMHSLADEGLDTASRRGDEEHARNTPLRARVAALEKQLSGAKDELLHASVALNVCQGWLKGLGAGTESAQANSWRSRAFESAHALLPAVTGTTSDKAPFRQPEAFEKAARAAASYLAAHSALVAAGVSEERPAAARRVADAWIVLTRACAEISDVDGVQPCCGLAHDASRPCPRVRTSSDLSLPHPFLPAPFYPERCDARVEDDGKRRQCGQPRNEHTG